jgi:WD40 repeat protein
LDQTIWLWDVEHHYYRAALHGHTAEIYGIAFTRDSTRLLSGSSDGTLRVWDVINGQCVRVMQGYAVSLYDLDWSLDGTRLACGGNDTLVTVWDLSGETPPRVLRGHRWVVIGVRWQPAGELLATSGWDDTLCLWDLTSDVPKQVIKKYGILNGISWTSDGHLLACGTVLQGVYVWEIPTCNLHWAAQAYLTSFRQVAWSPDNTVLAGGGDDSHIYMGCCGWYVVAAVGWSSWPGYVRGLES